MRYQGITTRMARIYWVLCAASFSGCGILPFGGASSNDPVPSGSLVAQGTFSSLNGNTVSGTAGIYQTTDSEFTVRLSSISVSDGASLQVTVQSDGATVYSSGLRSTSGTQNYSFTHTGSTNWNSVIIESTAGTSPDNQFGIALLQSTGG